MFYLFSYQQTVIEEDSLEATYNTDNEPIVKYETLIPNLIDFLRVVNEHSPLRPILKAHLPAIFYICIGYIQITKEQEELWISDPNEFISEEGQTEISNSVRSCALRLMGELADTFDETALKAMSHAVGQHMKEGKSWKIKEAVIQSVGFLYENFLESSALNIPEFASSLISDLNNQSSPFVRGRALWCIANFSPILHKQQLLPVLAACSHSLSDANEPFPVKVGACQALVT